MYTHVLFPCIERLHCSFSKVKLTAYILINNPDVTSRLNPLVYLTLSNHNLVISIEFNLCFIRAICTVPRCLSQVKLMNCSPALWQPATQLYLHEVYLRYLVLWFHINSVKILLVYIHPLHYFPSHQNKGTQKLINIDTGEGL